MFSGIIEAIGEIHTLAETPGGRTLTVRAPGYWSGMRLGASVAVDGVCLTIAAVDDRDARFDVVAETLRCSTLGHLRPGAGVNLQKALAIGDRVDGHFVQGHVDAVAAVVAVEQSSREAIWWFSLDPATVADPVVRLCTVPKGSIAIDGISLTVASLRENRFAVALIPTTLRETTIGQKRVGDRVNIETDILARTVVHYLQSLGGSAANTSTGPALSNQGLLDLLKREGFA